MTELYDRVTIWDESKFKIEEKSKQKEKEHKGNNKAPPMTGSHAPESRRCCN